MNTNDLIDELARELEPVTPLRRPGRRAAAWCLGAALYVAVLAAVMFAISPVADGAGGVHWLAQVAALATGGLASVAAFASVIPGVSRRSSVWALVAALVWLATLVATPPVDLDWSAVPRASHELICVGFIVIGGAPLMAALAVMLRRGAPLSPALTAALAALAVGTLTNVGACLSLPHSSGTVTLGWHGGVIVTLTALAALAGRFTFGWGAARSRAMVDILRR